jgi:beta-lactamase superfamily II metal-dependent hydrolase
MTRKVKIGMYNVGFGDAFLMRIETGEGVKKILIDCGSHPGGPGPKPMSVICKRIVEDVRDADGVPRIDVVVGTHRHADHVSGFQQKIWKQVEVGEVWMPWTEDPNDARARRILETQSSRALALFLGIRALARRQPAFDAAARASGLYAIARNNLKNQRAMDTLHDGFAGKPKRFFLPSKKRKRTFETPLLPGVKIHVLGPSRDESVMAAMDPPEEEMFFRYRASAVRQEPHQPFKENWILTADKVRKDAAYAHLRLREDIADTIASIGDGTDLAAAQAIDDAINNTSLMLLFEIGEEFFLFPGDSQWGTWDVAMRDAEWRKLLRKTSFLKVSHHGSENASPVTFVDTILGSGFRAMCSTRSMPIWEELPKKKLIERLIAKSSNRLARSDKATVTPPGFKREGNLYTETEIKV